MGGRTDAQVTSKHLRHPAGLETAEAPPLTDQGSAIAPVPARERKGPLGERRESPTSGRETPGLVDFGRPRQSLPLPGYEAAPDVLPLQGIWHLHSAPVFCGRFLFEVSPVPGYGAIMAPANPKGVRPELQSTFDDQAARSDGALVRRSVTVAWNR